MKRILSVVLIFAILGSTTSMGELLRFPYLINHYLEHKASYPSTTIFTFLHDHYLTKEIKQSAMQAKSHAELPYKSASNHHSQISPVILPDSSQMVDCVFVRSPFYSFHCLKVFSRPLAIWQPPKIC